MGRLGDYETKKKKIADFSQAQIEAANVTKNNGGLPATLGLSFLE